MKKPLRYDDAVGAFALCREGCCNKKHRAKTERFQNRYLIRLLQLSAAGEVFLEGTCPLSRCPQTAKFPAPCFWRTEKVGEKSDSFSRAERTRPLRPVCRLLHCSFGNVPVERFQRDVPLLKSADTACRVPTGHATKLQKQAFRNFAGTHKNSPPLDFFGILCYT